jgi:hypothetical protein
MFNLFKKIIDESVALQYASLLTGLHCSLIAEVKEVASFTDDDTLKDIFSNLNAAIGIENSFEFGLYSRHNYDHSDPVVTLQFQKGFTKNQDKIYLILNFLNGRPASKLFSVGVNYNAETSSDSDFYFDRERIELAVDLSRWMVAEGLNYGKTSAFNIITRTDFTPSRTNTGSARHDSFHLLNCPYCVTKLKIKEVYEKTEIRCLSCKKTFNVNP